MSGYSARSWLVVKGLTAVVTAGLTALLALGFVIGWLKEELRQVAAEST